MSVPLLFDFELAVFLTAFQNVYVFVSVGLNQTIRQCRQSDNFVQISNKRETVLVV